LTSHPGSGLLGNLTGKTLTATFTITGTALAATHYGDGQQWNACGTPTPASVRLYFEGNTNGPFENSHQWWSNPQAYTLTSLVGNTLTLTVPLNTANWYDRGFEPASDVPTDFAAAVATVGAVGVSFGGCGVFRVRGLRRADQRHRVVRPEELLGLVRRRSTRRDDRGGPKAPSIGRASARRARPGRKRARRSRA
jgi:hypothetical protein